jgi:hypothetical protein
VLVGIDQAGDDETASKFKDIYIRANFDAGREAFDPAAVSDQDVERRSIRRVVPEDAATAKEQG